MSSLCFLVFVGFVFCVSLALLPLVSLPSFGFWFSFAFPLLFSCGLLCLTVCSCLLLFFLFGSPCCGVVVSPSHRQEISQAVGVLFSFSLGFRAGCKRLFVLLSLVCFVSVCFVFVFTSSSSMELSDIAWVFPAFM